MAKIAKTGKVDSPSKGWDHCPAQRRIVIFFAFSAFFCGDSITYENRG
jgi:hypothetical protein